MESGSDELAVYPSASPARFVLALCFVLLAAILFSLHCQTLMSNAAISSRIISPGLHAELVALFPPEGLFFAIFPRILLYAVTTWLVCGFSSYVLTRGSLWESLTSCGLLFGWLLPIALVELPVHFLGLLSERVVEVWVEALPFVHTVAFGSFIAGWWSLLLCHARWIQKLDRIGLVVGVVLYATVFSVLGVMQYNAMMVPHGDSAMYEEHLWNLLHGKGFRSQLDGGRLFLGEHFQVIHIVLIPIYLLSPGLPVLNVCMAIIIASGAIAIYGIVRSFGISKWAAALLGWAYLLYYPLQYLNLEASMKSFRPENIGVPVMLFAIWCLELRRVKTALALMAITLLCKEDYAIPCAMVGGFMAVRRSATIQVRLTGLGVLVFSTLFLLFVLKFFIPYFRGGPPHYSAYYPEELGETPLQVAWTLICHPTWIPRYLLSGSDCFMIAALVVPIGCLSVLGWSRSLLALPGLASILLISELQGVQSPWFHFHAPIVPLLFWGSAEGIWRVDKWSRRVLTSGWAVRAACFAFGCSIVSGVIWGKSPLSRRFWDPHSMTAGYWRELYVEGTRVEEFRDLIRLVPETASVAATDYARPQLTHHRECHQYPLKVGVERVDFIVIDLTGPFSNPVEGLRIREVEEAPNRWLIRHKTGRFIVAEKIVADAIQPL